MCAHQEKSGGGYGKEMTVVAWSMLVMGISLAIVILLYAWFGWIGPTFSDDVLRNQQKTLREQYGLPPAEEITSKEAEIPPSLRGK